MKRLLSCLCLLLLCPLITSGQEASFTKEESGSVTLEQCRQAARRQGNFEALADFNQIKSEEMEKLIRRQNMPDLSFGGELHYQSDAPDPGGLTDFPFEIHKLNRFQYHAGVLLTQSIYNGGSTAVRKRLNGLNAEMDELELQELYLELDNSVDEIYLGIVLAQKEEMIAQSHLAALEISYNNAQNAFSEGAGYKKDVINLEAKIYSLEAKIAACRVNQETGAGMLSVLTGLNLKGDSAYVLPDVPDVQKPNITLQKLDLESDRLDLQQQLVRSAAMPHIKAFASAGYGCWPLNFFDKGPDFYALAGISFVVPITSWQDVSHKKKIVQAQQQNLQIRRDARQRSIDIEDLRYEGEISRVDALLEANSKTVEKYQELCCEMELLSASGECPTSEYLQMLEQLNEARVNQEVYGILRLQLQLQRQRNKSK